VKAAIQLEFLVNDWCAAHSRPVLLRTPRAALAENQTLVVTSTTDRSGSNAALDSPFDSASLGKAKGTNGRFRAGSGFPMKKPAVSDGGLGALERFVVRTMCQAASFGRICRL